MKMQCVLYSPGGSSSLCSLFPRSTMTRQLLSRVDAEACLSSSSCHYESIRQTDRDIYPVRYGHATEPIMTHPNYQGALNTQYSTSSPYCIAPGVLRPQ